MMDIPRPEHPRPERRRDDWLNLNGPWQFELDPGLSGEERGLPGAPALSGEILVPFCPESELSGVGHKDFMPCVWYRRTFTVPAAWRERRLLLHLGAVDYEATVWLNGQPVGRHRGGYTPFTCDLTAAVGAGENVLVVRAVDDTRSPLQPRGKQSETFASRGCDYTRTTGIWQTVWLEPVPAAHIRGFRLYPNVERGEVTIQARLSGPAHGLRLVARASVEGQPAGEASAAAGACLLTLPLEGAHLWEPGAPFLYDLELRLEQECVPVDVVHSYCALREVHRDGLRVLINGRSVFQRLVLDQGFYPEGVYTAPSDEALRRDVELSLAMGFNGARLHQKIFEPRFLYWADRLGYLVWGEYPNWGLNHAHPYALQRVLPEWLEAVERDCNHPSIIGWCPFNETSREQNPELPRLIYRATKATDPTRPVIDTSGYVHVETDIYDCHNYEQDPEKFAALFVAFREGGEPYRNFPDHDAPYASQPYFVSEYGGIGWNPAQSGEAWGYGQWARSAEELVARYRGLTEALLSHPKMFGFCYTQLYDIEQEQNGLYTYTREPKVAPELIRAINSQPAAIEA
jgi:beta-galactosidase/beta-glucuronidase